MYWVTKAEYVDDFRIRVSFSDAAEGIVDLSEMVHNDHRRIIRELEDRDQFKKFRVVMDTVVWDNGVDLAPEFLHDNIKR